MHRTFIARVDELRFTWDPARAAGRFIFLGLSALTRRLVVIHVYRERDDTIRLLSARKATRSERSQYSARWES